MKISTRLRRDVLAGSGAVVAALGLTVATVAFAPGVGANTVPIGSGTPTASDDGVLDWGLKESFRAYVEGPIADGEITMIAPATRSADGTFRFPDGIGEVDPEAGTATVQLAGGVSFYGHEGSLDLTIDDVRLEIAGGAGAIVVDMRSGAETYPDLEIVTLDLGGQQLDPDPDGVVSLADVATTLTAAGSGALGEFYPPGTAMDPFTFTITVDGADPTETPTTTPPTSTPPASPPPTSTPPGETETPPPPPDPSDSATWGEGEVSSGLLQWGVKESFRSYIAGPIADGGWTLDGITEGGGRFRWTASFGEYDMGDAVGSVGFVGGVRFTGHEGSLDIAISRPRVRFDGDSSAVLLVDVRSKSLGGGGVLEQTSVEFATLDLSAASSDIDSDSVSYARIPAVLTAAGAEGFGGFYEAGAELDPITIAFGVGGAQVPGGGSAGGPGGLAGTGSSFSILIAGFSGALVLLGGGLLVASRRLRPESA